jgi:hypothetical protein
MPAYNAAKTLEKTVSELPDIVDVTILVDDRSIKIIMDIDGISKPVIVKR